MTKVIWKTDNAASVKVTDIPLGTVFTATINNFCTGLFLHDKVGHIMILSAHEYRMGDGWTTAHNIDNYRPLRTVTITGEY